MAVFGAPLTQEDHAARACYAALTLQAALRAYARSSAARMAWRCSAASGSTLEMSWFAPCPTACRWSTPRWD